MSRSGPITKDPSRLAGVLRYLDAGIDAPTTCAELGISRATYFRCKRKLIRDRKRSTPIEGARG